MPKMLLLLLPFLCSLLVVQAARAAKAEQRHRQQLRGDAGPSSTTIAPDLFEHVAARSFCNTVWLFNGFDPYCVDRCLVDDQCEYYVAYSSTWCQTSATCPIETAHDNSAIVFRRKGPGISPAPVATTAAPTIAADGHVADDVSGDVSPEGLLAVAVARYAAMEAKLTIAPFQTDHLLAFFRQELGPSVRGNFVDVGAFEGLNETHTFALEKLLNWTGVCIEPYEAAAAVLERHRSCQSVRLAMGPPPPRSSSLAQSSSPSTPPSSPSPSRSQSSMSTGYLLLPELTVVGPDHERASYGVPVGVKTLDTLMNDLGLQQVTLLRVATSNGSVAGGFDTETVLQGLSLSRRIAVVSAGGDLTAATLRRFQYFGFSAVRSQEPSGQVHTLLTRFAFMRIVPGWERASVEWRSPLEGVTYSLAQSFIVDYSIRDSPIWPTGNSIVFVNGLPTAKTVDVNTRIMLYDALAEAPGLIATGNNDLSLGRSHLQLGLNVIRVVMQTEDRLPVGIENYVTFYLQ